MRAVDRYMLKRIPDPDSFVALDIDFHCQRIQHPSICGATETEEVNWVERGTSHL